MDTFGYLILGIIAIVILIVLMRLLGAWMLRINELIQTQKEIISLLTKININLKQENKKDDDKNEFEFLNK